MSEHALKWRHVTLADYNSTSRLHLFQRCHIATSAVRTDNFVSGRLLRYSARYDSAPIIPSENQMKILVLTAGADPDHRVVRLHDGLHGNSHLILGRVIGAE